jgi:hypothetical protein
MITSQEEAIEHVKPHGKILKESSVVIVCEDGGIYHGEDYRQVTEGKSKYFVIKGKKEEKTEPEKEED